MGYTTAVSLSEELDLEVALGYHLQGNHYPPVPLSMVEPCIEAIDAYWEEDFDRAIEMPEGVSYKGQTHAPAWAIVEQHHLDAWLPESD
ncbi:MAG: hypothetical protein EBV55_04105 [Burkholderiaceae bacterium]|jgi:hypothetical protein|nr:hypothetical protein [Burkholderiaceae bacterium]